MTHSPFLPGLLYSFYSFWRQQNHIVNINDCDFTLALAKAKMANVYLQPAGILLSTDHLLQATVELRHV